LAGIPPGGFGAKTALALTACAPPGDAGLGAAPAVGDGAGVDGIAATTVVVTAGTGVEAETAAVVEPGTVEAAAVATAVELAGAEVVLLGELAGVLQAVNINTAIIAVNSVKKLRRFSPADRLLDLIPVIRFW